MTKIYCSTEKMYLRMNGHAGGGPAGQDVICAGLSTLACALINMLNEEQEKGHIIADWNIRPEPLEVSISAKPKTEHYRQRTKDYFRVIIMGLKAMAQNYPENIELKEGQ